MLVKSKWSKVIPNADLGEFIAKSFLQRSLQISLDEQIYPVIWAMNIHSFSPYHDDARGGTSYFKVVVILSFRTSSGKSMYAYSQLDISCDSEEYLWKPNHCGSYVCVDRDKCFEVMCDFLSGNISIGVEGQGSHIPDEFRKDFEAIDWKQMKHQSQL
jgi:hypothetical protein